MKRHSDFLDMTVTSKNRKILVPASFRNPSSSFTKTGVALGISTAVLAHGNVLADESLKDTEMQAITVVERVIGESGRTETEFPVRIAYFGGQTISPSVYRVPIVTNSGPVRVPGQATHLIKETTTSEVHTFSSR